MTDSEITVELLADVPEFGEAVIEWIFNEWGSSSGRSLDELKKKVSHFENRTKLPILFVAHDKREPVGCVVLRAHDMKGFEDLSPWLASLYVCPTYRGRGIAQQLVEKLLLKASELEMDHVYLFTEDSESLYFKLGWDLLKRVDYEGVPAAIFSKSIS